MRDNLFIALEKGSVVTDKFDGRKRIVIEGSGRKGSVKAATYTTPTGWMKDAVPDEKDVVEITKDNMVAFKFEQHPESKQKHDAKIEKGVLLVDGIAIPNNNIEAEKILAIVPGFVVFTAKNKASGKTAILEYDVYKDTFRTRLSGISFAVKLAEAEGTTLIHAGLMETYKFPDDAKTHAGETVDVVSANQLVLVGASAVSNGDYFLRTQEISFIPDSDKTMIDEKYALVKASRRTALVRISDGGQPDENDALDELVRMVVELKDPVTVLVDMLSAVAANDPLPFVATKYTICNGRKTCVHDGIVAVNSPVSSYTGRWLDMTGIDLAGYVWVDTINDDRKTKLVFTNAERKVKYVEVESTSDRGTFIKEV